LEDLLLVGEQMIFLDSILKVSYGPKFFLRMINFHVLVLAILLVLGLMSVKEIVCIFLEAKMMKIIN
jgi:hypothetical protein